MEKNWFTNISCINGHSIWRLCDKAGHSLKCPIGWLFALKNYPVEKGEVSRSNSIPEPEKEMATEDLKLFNQLLREKLVRVTNENKEFEEKLHQFENLKKTGNSAG